MGKNWSCLKLAFLYLNLFTMLICFAALGVGVWMQVYDQFQLFSYEAILSAAGWTIALGSLGVVISFLGCCGLVSGSIGILKTVSCVFFSTKRRISCRIQSSKQYFVCVLVVFVGEVFTSIYAFLNSRSVSGNVALFLKYNWINGSPLKGGGCGWKSGKR